jgi:hypothetical protein
MVQMLADSVFPNLEMFGIKEEIGYSLAYNHTKKIFSLYKNGAEQEPFENMGLEDDESFKNAPEHLEYQLVKGIGDLTITEELDILDYCGLEHCQKVNLKDIWLQGKHIKLINL